METFELIPNDGHKSFYHKAQVTDFGNGEAVLYSYSYGTPVIKRTSGGEFKRLWPGYSATTMRHISAFVETHKGVINGHRVGNAWWDSLEVVEG